jgi:hypothetical protein
MSPAYTDRVGRGEEQAKRQQQLPATWLARKSLTGQQRTTMATNPPNQPQQAIPHQESPKQLPPITQATGQRGS